MYKLPFKFRDVIHDFIEFPNNPLGETALKIVESSTYQRLRRLSQLGMAKLVYPGAEHSRFSHSLGAFNLAQKVIQILGEKNKLKDVSESEQHAVCLAALMHDIGHCMFSHASESMWDFKHEDQTYKLIAQDQEIKKILQKYPSTSDFSQLIIDILKGENLSNNKYFLHDIVSSQMDVDRMDYILRDAHMTGVRYGSYDLKWILEHLTIAEFNGKYRLVIERKAIDAVEQYLTARFYMYRNVYEHKTARIFEVMLQALINEIRNYDDQILEKHQFLWLKGPNFDNLEEYKLLDDYKMWEALKVISYHSDFSGHARELALDFLYNRRWDRVDAKSSGKGFADGFYHTRVKASKFYDQEPDKQILVLTKDKDQTYEVKSADLFLLTKKEKLKKNLLSGEQIQMNNNWLEIAVNTTTIVGELLSSFLSEHGAKGVVIGEWKPDSLSEVTVTRSYFPEEETDTISLIQKIQEQLEHYRNSGINTGAGEVSVKVVREEDWANSWKKYFHTFRVGKNMIIKPLWEEYQAQEGELVIDIDPGMAFGTGTHATTKLCLEELELLAEQITDKENYQILDLGTGSGILAMALYLFGFRQITAIDNDPVAVRVATENLEMNKIKANLFRGEIKDCQAKYELIVGNILAEVIISLAEEINEKLKPGGVFIGSGIIRAREEQVIETLTGTGLKYVQTKADGDWLMIRFQKD